MDDGEKIPNQDSNWQYNPSDSSTEQLDGYDLGQNTSIEKKEVGAIEWSASEYVEHEKEMSWYAALLAGGLLLTATIFIITRDYLASSVVMLAIVSIAIFAGRKPETKLYSVGKKGIQIGNKTYSYSQFRSFSVVEEGAINSIWLKPLKRFAPAVIMYYSPEDEQRIVEVLSEFLPHEDRELDAIDRFSKRVRF